MSEWAVYWQAFGSITAVIVGTFGLLKIFHELKRLNEQRANDLKDTEISARLKRTEFFLDQHRRLFDDAELSSVLALIDDDNELLAPRNMWDKKRKFLTYFEEIALLVNSKQLSADVAYYMFGYYARSARDGKNFAIGIDFSESYWALFYKFAKDSEDFSAKYPSGPQEMSL